LLWRIQSAATERIVFSPQSDAKYGEAAWAEIPKYRETVGNTPVVRINRLAPQAELFVKIEAFNPLAQLRTDWRSG